MAVGNMHIEKLVDKDGNTIVPMSAFKDSTFLDASSVELSDASSGFLMFGKYVADNGLDGNSGMKFVVYDASSDIVMGTIDCPFDSESGSASKVMNGNGELSKLSPDHFTVSDGVISLSSQAASRWADASGSSSQRFFLSISSANASDSSGYMNNCEISRFSNVKGLYFDDDCNIWGVSDERIKDIVSEMTVDPHVIKAIRKIFFKFKESENNTVNLGVTAQSVESVFPEIVSTAADGTKAVAYDKLAVIALAAVDSLQSQIDEMNARLSALEKNIKKY